MSDTEIQQIATEIAGGRPPMVWFTAAAVGVPEGRSGKVVEIGDRSESDFLRVKPTGSKDVLSFSPTEVTLTKPSRDKAATTSSAQPKSTTRKEAIVTQPSTLTSPAPPAPQPAPSPTPTAAAPKPVAPATEPAKPAAPAGAAKPAAKAPAAARSKAKAPEVTVTLTGTADGEWSVEVVSGKKKSVRGLPVTSSAVAQAAKVLHPEVAEVVAGILEAARVVQESKVQQLQAELEEARRLLDELSD
ncbi:DUF6319 family protein [Nocardia sp. NPDC049707]|uniref:DUF6319 family protein n=1 Tax=Nocardia sp. NPDC049707 TaxID=3154735 RepID=UPI0034402EC8